MGFSQSQYYENSDQFKDYHISKGSSFKCWDAAWRTWLRNSLKFNSNKSDNFINLMARAAREKSSV